MTENNKSSPLPPNPPASADMMSEGGGSGPRTEETAPASKLPGQGEPRRQKEGKSAASMTLLARLRRGWSRGDQSTGDLPNGERPQFWKLTGLWLLFAFAVYAAWSALGFAD